MRPKTHIPSKVLQAYRKTLYRVKARPRSWVLRVGKSSGRLQALYRQEGLKSAAFITAYNPYGVRKPKAANVKAQERLVGEVRRKGWAFLPGRGEDPKGKWAGEASLLILGIPRAAARTLGRKYRQNAIVFAGRGGIPRLVLLK